MNLLTAAVLAAGVRLVDAVLPAAGAEGSAARAADDPREVRDRVLRAVALGAVLVIARRAGRVAAGRARSGRRGRRGRSR